MRIKEFAFRVLKTRWSLITGCLFLFTLASCKNFEELRLKARSALGLESKKKASKQNNESSGEGEWTYFAPRRADLVDAIEVQGKLEASEKIDIVADKRMRIGPAKFKVADQVKRGDVIFIVDTKEFEQKNIELQERVAQLTIDIKASRAQVELASKQVDRKQGLVTKGIAAQKELEDLQKTFVTADSDLKTKELELRKTERELATAKQTVLSSNIVSPINGTVATISAGGDEVNQGQSLVLIENPAYLSLAVSVNETLVTKLKVGQTVNVLVEAVKDKKIDGKIKSIDSTSDGSSGMSQYTVKVEIKPEIVKSLNLLNGFDATMQAINQTVENTLSVPLSAIKKNGSETYLMVAESKGKSPTARAAKIGIQTQLEAQVLSGLKDAEFVAVAAPKGDDSK